MRFAAAGLLVLVSSATLVAIDLGRKPESVQAQRFARALLPTSGLVSQQFVRPVSRADVVRAALEGLYEAAGQPAPASLSDDVRRADANDMDLVAFLRQTREQLGNPEPLRELKDILAALRGMTRVLDAHCGPVTADEVSRGDGADPSGGLGLEVQNPAGGGPLVVKAVLPGGPAQRAGVRPGDRITHVDGKPVDGTPAAFQRLHGGAQAVLIPTEKPAHVALTVTRSSGKPLDVTLEREEFRTETVLGVMRHDDNGWDYFADRAHRIAHVRIATLASGTAEELFEVLTSLKEQGMRGLVLDLRWCPGGVLTEAVNISQLFVGAEKVATVEPRASKPVEYRGSGERKFGVPLVVLVNAETSGGAELIAAAIQDNERGVVAGQRTRGKGSVQSQMPLPVPGVLFKLTTGTFRRPSGKAMHRFADSKPADDWGVRPDPGLESRVTPILGTQLKEWWQTQTLRPGSSREILPLDDPANDPQRQDAVRVLLRSVKEEG